jgi:RNA polymerase sigma-70 factor (ECF subfamily)
MTRSGGEASPPNKELSDEALMLRTGQGDRGAFDEIVRRYMSRMVNVAYQMTGDSELSQDIAQETFYRAYRSAATYKQIAKFSTWLYTIALNLCRNELRRRKHRFYSLEEMAERDEESSVRIDIEDESARPDRDVEQNELGRLIVKAIDTLPEKFKQPIVLRDIEGLSYEETGRILNLPEGTVKSRINRARQRVKELLRPFIDETSIEET